MNEGISGLDPLIHAPKRLAAMAMLDATTQTDFPFMRDHLGLSDSDLSKQMSALQAADYVRITKSGRGRGSTTTFEITATGRSAYRQHRAALRALLGGVADQAPASPTSPVTVGQGSVANRP